MRIDVKNLNFGYTHKLVLNNLSFSINSGEFLTLIGKNGTGKSTLIKCLLKLEPVANNSILYENIDINLIKKFINVGYVPQRIDFNYEFPITVSEILSSAYVRRIDDYYTSIINNLNLNRIYRDNINNLSGGQLQRVFIARALLNKPSLLILDEPTVGIDIENIQALLRILEKLKSRGVTIIVSTHDLHFASDLSDSTLELLEVGEYKFWEGKNNVSR